MRCDSKGKSIGWLPQPKWEMIMVIPTSTRNTLRMKSDAVECPMLYGTYTGVINTETSQFSL